MIRAVFLDIGETIVDETQSWGFWADRLGVPRLTFFAMLGVLIERGEPHWRVFELFRPGMDAEAERARLQASGELQQLSIEALYADARPCLKGLADAGYRVGLAGNQPRWVEDQLRSWELDADVIASSEEWGVTKPSAEFFRRVVEAAEARPEEIVYVGDRLDNDVLPAQAAGMTSVFLRRGPWGLVDAAKPEAAQADIRIDSLDELLPALRAYKA